MSMRQLPRLAVGYFVFARFAGMSMKHRLLFVRIFRHGHITTAVFWTAAGRCCFAL